MQAFVVDTSALARWWGLDSEEAMAEGYPPEMEGLYARARSGEVKVFAPAWLMQLEVTNVVVYQKQVKAKAITRGEADALLATFLGLRVVQVLDAELLPRALEVVREQSIALYDAFYVALALREKATLLTCDGTQRKAWLAAKDGRRRVLPPKPKGRPA